MSYKLRIEETKLEDNDSFVNTKGNHECVVFVQQATGAPPTTLWKKGIHVMDAPVGSILKGTVIATFDENDKYPATDRHAAIYLQHDKTGIDVYDQWNKQGKVKKRTLHHKKLKKRSVNDAEYFYVVE